MKIRLLMNVSNSKGSGKVGDVVDWPESTCQALIDGQCAEVYRERPEPKAKPAKGDD